MNMIYVYFMTAQLLLIYSHCQTILPESNVVKKQSVMEMDEYSYRNSKFPENLRCVLVV